MARLSTVEFWPATGFVDRPWVEDPGEDAFVKTATRICERFSEALRDGLGGAVVENSVGSIRFFTGRHADPDWRGRNVPADPVNVLVEVVLDRPHGFEMATVTLPQGIEALTAQERARLVLEVICAATGRLGAVRGWDRQVLAAARQHVIDHGYGYEAVGPWKASPSRRHRARCVFGLADDGFGRLTLQVADAGSEEVVAWAGPYLAYSTREGFARSVRTLRWTGRTTVEASPYIDPIDRSTSPVTLDLEGNATTPPDTTSEPATTSERQFRQGPSVVARGVGAAAPEQPHELRVCGGGPMNDTSRVYTRTLNVMLQQLETEPWQRWWAQSPVAVLDIYYWFDNGKPGIRVQRRSNAATASITRAARNQGRGADGVEQAHADVTTLVDRVRTRFDLPHPPDLRLIDPTPKASRPQSPTQ